MPWSGAATGPSPFKVGDNQRPKRAMTGVRKPSPESSVPVGNLTRGSRRNQLRRGHGSPPVLSEVPHELSTASYSKECKRSPQQFIPAGFPPHDNLQTGDGRLSQPLTTPDMVRSGRVLPTSVKSLLFQWNKHPVFHRVRHLFPCFGSLERLLAENFLGNNQSFASLILLYISSVRL